MPLYAGHFETDITPPIGLPLVGRPAHLVAVRIADPLACRALVLHNDAERLAIVTADVYSLSLAQTDAIRESIADRIQCRKEAVMLACSAAMSTPEVRAELTSSLPDPHYLDILFRKIVGTAEQAAQRLEPARISFGETSEQIGLPRKALRYGSERDAAEATFDLAGAVHPAVSSLCVTGADGRIIALLFSHGCLPGYARDAVTAGWPGFAVRALKERFAREQEQDGAREDAMSAFLQGCADRICLPQPEDRAVQQSTGRRIADAAYAAKWNAHGHADDRLHAFETPCTLHTDRPNEFPLQLLRIGAVRLIGIPGLISPHFQLDIAAQCFQPALLVNCANGCIASFRPAREADAAGRGYEEAALRAALYATLEIKAPDTSPFTC